MTRLQFAIAVCAILFGYLIAVISRKPVSSSGKFFLKLSMVNVVSWLLFLPLSDRGHPPPQIIFGFVLWLLNSPVLIALAVALWMSFKAGEQKAFLIAAAIYLTLNITILWIVPVIGLYRIS